MELLSLLIFIYCLLGWERILFLLRIALILIVITVILFIILLILMKFFPDKFKEDDKTIRSTSYSSKATKITHPKPIDTARGYDDDEEEEYDGPLDDLTIGLLTLQILDNLYKEEEREREYEIMKLEEEEREEEKRERIRQEIEEWEERWKKQDEE